MSNFYILEDENEIPEKQFYCFGTERVFLESLNFIWVRKVGVS